MMRPLWILLVVASLLPWSSSAQAQLEANMCVPVLGDMPNDWQRWEANFVTQLRLPYRAHQIDLRPTVSWEALPSMEGVTLVQGFHLMSVDSAANLGLPESAALLAAREFPSKHAIFGDSALILDRGGDRFGGFSGIAVVESPLVEWVCDLKELQVTQLANLHRCSDEYTLRTLVVPTRYVLCRWAASGFEKEAKTYPDWVNTSFVPWTRTDEVSGLYRKFLPAHEVAHVLLDGGNFELHVNSPGDLMYPSGGAGIVSGAQYQRMTKESGPDATPALLRGSVVSSTGFAESRLRRVESRIGSLEDCQCDLSLDALSQVVEDVTELLAFLKSLSAPVSAFPALAELVDKRELARPLWSQFRQSFGRRHLRGKKAQIFMSEPNAEEALAVFVAAVSEALVCTDLSSKEWVGACLDDCPSKVQGTLRQVVAADQACLNYQERWALSSGRAAFLERYVRIGFNFVIGQQTFDLYGGSAPMVRWARQEFPNAVTSRAQLRELMQTLPTRFSEDPAYRSYLAEVAGL